MKRVTPDALQRLLVRSTNWIGDAVMTTPALAAIRETFPRAEITLLANPLVAQLFSHHPSVDRVITFDRGGKHRGIGGRLRLAAELRAERFELAILLPNSFDSALIPFLAGIPKRWGKASDGRSLLLTERYQQPAGTAPQHETDYYLELLQHFGISGSVTEPLLTTTAEEDLAARELLAHHSISSQDLVLGINAGASYGSAKRWYPERFAEAAGRLANQWNARIVLFGGPGERDIVDKIEDDLHGECLNLAGKTSVRQLMALIKRSDFFITNDSGPMHIAAAFGVPLLAIFGPTDHTGTAPCSKHAIILRKECDCAPCKLRVCPTDHACMTAVTADDVVAAATELYRKITTRGNHRT